MEFALQLRHCSRQQHAVAGVLIPGADPAEWLSVAATWDVPTTELRFLPVQETRRREQQATLSRKRREIRQEVGQPAKGTEAAIIGALCYSTKGQLPAAASSHPFVLPYRCRVDRLFLPVNSDVDPAVSESDLLQLLLNQRQYVWHPTIGLTGYDPEHVLAIHDLLVAPHVETTDWDAAEIGEQLNDTIRNLFPEPPPAAGMILQLGQDDIGTQTDSIDDAPRAPNEKSGAAIRDAAQNAVDTMNAAFAKAVHGLTSRMPTSDNGNQFWGRLHEWAESILSGSNSAGSGNQPGQPPDARLTARRENELKRLMNLLENDPDRGLKYALPMGGEDRGRGIASPSDHLTENDADFNLNQFQRSGQSDIWDLPWGFQARLIQKYRELAQREQRLGRFRRAAYIYASLLGDMPAAASALEAGNLFHDAAGVYIEHLKNPIRAAECLRRGGFWEESVQIYRNHERWLDAAELYAEIGRVEDAREMFHLEIEECKERRDFVAAGSLADHRLNDPELATMLLFNGWMQGTNGASCFRQLMDLNGRRGNHREATWAMQQLTAEDELGQQQLEDAVQVCSEAAATYPDEVVRTNARQHTLRLAACILKTNDFSSQKQAGHHAALVAVRSLAHSDRLLQADTHRFEHRDRLVAEAQHTPSLQPHGKLRPLKHVATFDFQPDGTPDGTRWLDIVGSGRNLFRCGLTPQKNIVVACQQLRGQSAGKIQSIDRLIVLPNVTALAPKTFGLRLQGDQDHVVVMSLPGTTQSWASMASLSEIRNSNFVDVLSGISGAVWDARAMSKNRMLSLVLRADELATVVEVNVHNSNGLLDRTIEVNVPWEELASDSEHMSLMLSVATHAHLLLDRNLLRIVPSLHQLMGSTFETARAEVVEQFPHMPTRMTESPPRTFSRIVVSFAEGARAIWTESGESCDIAVGLVNPITTFASNGILVAACQETGRVCCYRLNHHTADLIAEVSSGRSIRFLTCGITPNQFLVFHDDGQVTQFEIPVR